MVSLRSLLFSLFVLALPVFSQELDQPTRHAVIGALAKQLRDGYVSEQVGNQLADHVLAREKEQAYAPITDPALFATRLTEDLYTIAHDKHLRVRFNSSAAEVSQDLETELIDQWKARALFRERNEGYAAVQVLPGNIGYLEVTGFSGIEAVRQRVDAAFLLLQDVDALILDLRRNGGGEPSGVQYLCSYLLPENVHLNTLVYRNQPDDVSRTVAVPGKRLLDVPVLVLTSAYTFSGGEECAYDLQTQKRATLIGETTGGGANPGGMVPLGHGFGCFLPGGKAVNPITGTNWEGVGVVPDVACSAADALNLAQTRATELIQAKRDAALAKYLDTQRNLRKLLAENTAYDALLVLIKAAVADGQMNEAELNNLGYRYMSENQLWAEQIFRANVDLFPDSSNTYDSYGEALAATGKREQAIAAYKKAIEVATAQGKQSMVELHQQGLARLNP